MNQGTEHSQEPLKLRADGIVWRQVGDELVLLELESGRYLSVNQTGATLWPLLLEGCPATRLVDELVQSYGIAPEQAREDADRFLASLRGMGMLEAVREH